MDLPTILFAQRIHPVDIRGKRVLEVGSRNVNGSVRPFVESHSPSEYIGTDIERGPGVDRIVSVHDLSRTFGPESFDLVICCNVLEHIEDWRSAIYQIKTVCRVGGRILLTMPRPGFMRHGFPSDYWRASKDCLQGIFADTRWIECDDMGQFAGIYCEKRLRGAMSLHNKHLYRVGVAELVAAWIEAARDAAYRTGAMIYGLFR